jgi:urease subunit gamma
MQLTPRERQMAISMGRSGPQAAGPWVQAEPPSDCVNNDAVVEGAREPFCCRHDDGALVPVIRECMGHPEMIHDIQVEATFPDGTKLVTVHNPIR